MCAAAAETQLPRHQASPVLRFSDTCVTPGIDLSRRNWAADVAGSSSVRVQLLELAVVELGVACLEQGLLDLEQAVEG